MFRLLCVAHLAHLVGEGFKPGLVCFHLGDHFGKSVRIVLMIVTQYVSGVETYF